MPAIAVTASLVTLSARPAARTSIGATRPRAAPTPRLAPTHICRVASRDPEPSAVSAGVEDLAKRAAALTEPLSRYDWLSAGLGALAVTTVCVAHGQDPATALWITAASTVVALVVNDFIFESKRP